MMVPALALLLSLAAEIPPPVAQGRQPQIAAQGRAVVLTYGSENSVFFARSDDEGRTWSKPAVVWSGGRLSLGLRRGPRIAMTKRAILISATVDRTGSGGDLLLWRSTDGGRTWSKGRPLNDAPGAAREGLHGMAANGDVVFAAWLDARNKGAQLFGAVSSDGGARWSPSRAVYASPSGSICECCHPDVAVDARGNISVLFRNQRDGNRDMYLARSSNGGRTFAPALKLGDRSWRLNACPMDGGDLKLDPGGNPVSVWRRQSDLYLSDSTTSEKRLAAGKNAVLAVTRDGTWVVFQGPAGLQVTSPGDPRPHPLAAPGAERGSFPSLAVTSTGRAIAAWESEGAIRVASLDR